MYQTDILILYVANKYSYGIIKLQRDGKTPACERLYQATAGVDLLQSVPNMSIIRKGGSSGDPLFRGLGGSRLPVSTLIYGSSLSMVTFKPRDSRIVAIEAAAIPLPKEDTTLV